MKYMIIVLLPLISALISGCTDTMPTEEIPMATILPLCDSSPLLITNLALPPKQRRYLLLNGQRCLFSNTNSEE